MKDKIKIFALGGLDQDGCSLYCVEINDSIYVISCGLGYPDKSAPGIDYIVPDVSYLKENKHRVKAYIISHSHDDTMWGLPFIYQDAPAPIYMSKFANVAFNSFLANNKVNISVPFNIRVVDPNQDIIIDNRLFQFFSITHSAPEAFGIAIDTSEGNIIFSGDFIIEYNPYKAFNFNFKKLNEIVDKKQTYILLGDSINAGRKGFTSPNHKVGNEVRKIINDCDGRVYIACYYQDAYNYVEALEECINANKYICFYDEESLKTYKGLEENNIFRIPESKLISLDGLSTIPDKDIVIFMLGTGEFLYRKISMLALKDIKDKRLYIKESDYFILLCPPAPNFEVLSVGVLDELYRTDCRVDFLNRKQLKKMHPSEDDIKFLISIIKPKYYIPIKGQYKDLVANATIGATMNIGLNHTSIFLLDNGNALDFSFENPKISSIENDKVRVGTIMVDGTGVGDVANEIINERNILSQDGIIVMSCLISLSKKKIIGGPDIQMRGFLFLKESEPILKKIQQIFIETVEKNLQNQTIFDENKTYKEIKDEVNKFTRKSTLRTPMIEPQLLIIE